MKNWGKNLLNIRIDKKKIKNKMTNKNHALN